MFARLMIARALSGHFAPHSPFTCSAENDPSGDPAASPAKTFTQDEVNRIAAKQKAEGEAKARADAATEFAAKEAAHLKRIEELELAGKTQAERDAHERKQREDADKKAREAEKATLAKERDDEKAAREQLETRWKQDRKNTAASNALVAADVIGDAAADAMHVFVRDSTIDMDDDGAVTNVIYGGKSYPKIEDAAKAFLKAKPHFAMPSGTGGTGSRLPGARGGAGAGNGPTDTMSREELIAGAAAERQAARSQRR